MMPIQPHSPATGSEPDVVETVDVVGEITKSQDKSEIEAPAVTLMDEPKEPEDPSLIDFDGPDDPYQPLNWPMKKKLIVTLLYSSCTTCTTWASTIYTSGVSQIEARFHVSEEVALLGMTLYLFGNAFGPLLFAPVSEAFGRKISVLVPVFAFMLFSFASATAKDIQTLLITRFFAGVFGSAPLSNGGAVFADIWPPQQRGGALIIYGLASVVTPLVSPIVGGALVVGVAHDGWRWTEYVTGIMLAVTFVLCLLFIDESYPPVLLARKANKIRLETKNWAIHAKSQESDFSFKYMAKKYLIVPIDMFREPIGFFINLYSGFVYAIIYLAITAFPYEFQVIRGWNELAGSLPFIGTVVGVLFAAVINFWGQLYYKKRFIANGNKIIPEARLVPMMIGSFFLAAGLFIMGWTGKPDIPWIGFTIGGACTGLGFFTIFQSSVNYLVDTYLMLSASALAANMLLRSILAGVFPLFSSALFINLGVDWGMSLLGILATAMIPIPVLFYIYGRRLRAIGKRSKLSFIT